MGSVKFDMQPVPKAKNLAAIGWTDGYMLVQFRRSPDKWIFGPQIPEAELGKILANPFPDRLFHLNVKTKFYSHKVKP